MQQAQHSKEEHERLKEEYQRLKEKFQRAQTMTIADKKELAANKTELDSLRKSVSVKDREIEELRQQLQNKVFTTINGYFIDI